MPVVRSVYGHVIAKFSGMDRARDQIKYCWKTKKNVTPMGRKMSTWYSQVMTASGCSSLTAFNWPSLESNGEYSNKTDCRLWVWVRHFSPACSGEMPDRVPEPTLLIFWLRSAQVPFWQLSINLNLACAYGFKLLTAQPWESTIQYILQYNLRICSCLACVYRVMDARGKFGEHERCVRVARGDSRVQL